MWSGQWPGARGLGPGLGLKYDNCVDLNEDLSMRLFYRLVFCLRSECFYILQIGRKTFLSLAFPLGIGALDSLFLRKPQLLVARRLYKF